MACNQQFGIFFSEEPEKRSYPMYPATRIHRLYHSTSQKKTEHPHKTKTNHQETTAKKTPQNHTQTNNQQKSKQQQKHQKKKKQKNTNPKLNPKKLKRQET